MKRGSSLNTQADGLPPAAMAWASLRNFKTGFV